MERKIGEIFEYNGEWYQCVESDSCGECSLFTTECGSGTKSNLADIIFGQCSRVRRSDNKHAIFKKLEKVGEPYEYDGHIFQGYHVFEEPIFTENYATIRELGNDSKISIEIKQNKKDMEENKLSLKPFDLQKAKEGKPVCTRDGRKARIICFDFRDVEEICCLIAAVDYGEAEKIHYYDLYGKYRGGDSSEYDLMMLPEKKEGWVNVYYDNDASSHRGCRFIYDTKEEAIKGAGDSYIATIKISWEE